MKLPGVQAKKDSNFPPILVVDKIGVIGEELAKSLIQDFLVVLVSKSVKQKYDKIIHIPFKRRIPQIPDNNYKKIFIVDDGDKITHESISSFIAKAKEDGAPLYFIGSLRNVDIKSADEVAQEYENAKVLIFGDLFDKDIFFDKDIAINRYILEARKNQKIQIEGNGLELSYPISFTDTIKLIIKASYLDIPQKIILLFYPHPITDISLANTFKKINPETKIDFVKEGKRKNMYLPGNGQHAIKNYDLQEKIEQLDLENGENRKLTIIPTEKIKENKTLSFVILILTLLIFLLLLPLITTAGYLYIGERELRSSIIAVEEGDIERAKSKAESASSLFEFSKKTIKPLLFELKIIGREKGGSYFVEKTETGIYLSGATIDMLEGAGLVKNIQRNISTDPRADFTKASNLFKNAITEIAKARTSGSLSPEIKEKIDNLKPFISVFSSSSQILPDLFGFDGEMTYLVLFQDNTHLRPGGGLIKNYGILKVGDGRVKDFEVFDTGEIDKKLTAKIEPPFLLRRYLPTEELTFKDSNFSPDFVQSAIQASSIYTLATKENIDGVIGVDYDFAKNLLEVVGGVKVKGLGNINSENLYSNASNKYIYDDLSLSLIKKIKTDDSLSYIKLAEMVGKSINDKSLIFGLRDSGNQKLFTANGWSSAVFDNRDSEINKINDYIGISEANLGTVDLNEDISRSVLKKVSIGKDGSVASSLSVSFKNTSKTKGEKGVYKNFLQLLVPIDAQVEEVLIDGKKQEAVDAITNPRVYESSGFIPPEEFEIYENEVLSKKNLGLFITVSPGKTKSITITYTLDENLNIDNEIAYSLKIFKQPGVRPYPFEVYLDLSSSLRTIGDKKIFDKNLTKDEELRAVITKN